MNRAGLATSSDLGREICLQAPVEHNRLKQRIRTRQGVEKLSLCRGTVLATLARNTETAHQKYMQVFLESGCQQIGALISWPADLRKGRSNCGASLDSAFLGPGLST